MNLRQDSTKLLGVPTIMKPSVDVHLDLVGFITDRERSFICTVFKTEFMKSDQVFSCGHKLSRKLLYLFPPQTSFPSDWVVWYRVICGQELDPWPPTLANKSIIICELEDQPTGPKESRLHLYYSSLTNSSNDMHTIMPLYQQKNAQYTDLKRPRHLQYLCKEKSNVSIK